MSDSQRLRAIIEGDARGAVRAFDQVADGAERMGKDVDRAAKQSGRSLKDFEQAGQQAAQGLALLGGAFAIASREMVVNERQQALLTRQYGEQADALRALSDEIQQTTTFSNEQAVQAINSFATLQRNYGLTAEQIETLTRVTVDLAAATGFELNDAAMRVQSAIRGEGEAAEALGLTMNQQSIDRQNLTLTMSNQEAAQFRLNALLEQTAFAEGAAAERAATTAGQVTQLANQVQDATQRFVQFTGPIGEAAGSLGSFGLEAGLAAGGLVRLGQGLATAAPMASGLLAVLGPAGLIAAVGLVSFKLLDLAGAADSKVRPSVEGLTGTVGTLTDALNELYAVGDPTALIAAPWKAAMEEMTAAAAKATEETMAGYDAMNQGGENTATMAQAVDGELSDLAQTWIDLGLDMDGAEAKFEAANKALAILSTSQAVGAESARNNIEALFAAYERGDLTMGQLLDAIIATADGLDRYNAHATEATASTEALGTAAEGTSKSIGVLFTGTKELSDRLKDYEEGGERAALTTERLVEDAIDHVAALAQQGKATAQGRISADDYADSMARLTTTTGEAGRSFEDLAAKNDIAIGTLSRAESAYQNLTNGILTANEAQSVFKITQDGLITSQGVYSQQQSEYEAQLGSLQEAEDILNQRREDGVALTAEQADFLDRVNAAQERLTGGAEDAAVAEGMLALQYAENVRIGDQLNSTMEGQQAITGALIGLVFDLIGALDGIPDNVKTDIELAGADAAIGQAASLSATLSGIPTSKRIEIVTAFSQSGTPPALAGLGGGIAFQHGGVVPHAQHGLVTPGGARFVHMNEAGGEDVLVPGGSYIRPAPASRLARGAGGGAEFHLHFHGDIIGPGNLEQAVARGVTQAMVGAGR